MSAGCSNHGCFIEKPVGMGTNGPCHCLDPLGKEKSLAIRRKLSALVFYQQRVEELERRKKEFPEPYYTTICNILANGKLKA